MSFGTAGVRHATVDVSINVAGISSVLASEIVSLLPPKTNLQYKNEVDVNPEP
jgi:hypothetical protein